MEKLGEKITFTWDTKISITAQLSHIAIPIYIYIYIVWLAIFLFKEALGSIKNCKIKSNTQITCDFHVIVE